MKKIAEIILIHKENLQNLGISLIAIILFIFAVILPTYMTQLHLKLEIETKRGQIEEHKTLLPIYQSLSKDLKEKPTDLIVPEIIRLEKTEFDIVLKSVRSILDKNKMAINTIIPDLSPNIKNNQSIAVNLAIKGNFENFRAVMMDFGALPYIYRIQEFSIQQRPNTQTLDFKLKILLAIK